MAAAAEQGSQQALCLLAHGSEELEYATIFDLLTRAGVQVVTASVGLQEGEKFVRCSRGLRIVPDGRLEDLPEKDLYQRFQLLVLPGGMPGAQTFAGSHVIHALVKDFFANGRLLGLICAAPIVLREARLSGGRETWVEGKIRLTSHPSVKAQLIDEFAYEEDDVVVHKRLVTSRGPGTAIIFTLRLIELLLGKAKADEVAGPLMLPTSSA